ncbi:CheR family methyltransferase [Chondromyces apiculatus]|uniref:Chemotaxis protein methyltransferase CheR n=1 Tax=Chondromyces apiculatus DSM 436 TaxID=1192034 RepID=A0A017TAA8_9BACT|nr:CheR family methyltransferase [Chondromyces apiculatus]EYF06159.1 Chemotaxis protein methyltransferase CheR [Chondromyces apiculatus DSM 436]
MGTDGEERPDDGTPEVVPAKGPVPATEDGAEAETQDSAEESGDGDLVGPGNEDAGKEQPELSGRPPEAEEDEGGSEEERAFGVVGIGASAGSLESLEALLRNLRPDTGLAFVLVQHLDPRQDSLLPELAARFTTMPVITVTQSLPLEPDHLYVMPPGTTVLLVAGRLTLEPRPTRGQNMPIDLFFRSLAMECRGRAIGVILSGMGTDGALGVKAIKAEGGLTFAESDETAKHSAMPRSAIATGCIDGVFSAPEIGSEISLVGPRLQGAYSHDELERGLGGDQDLRRIIALLRGAKRVDFSLYRHTTIRRRIIRRMLLHKLHRLADYLKLLKDEPAEIDALYQDVLIRVTSFFRDPAVHEILKETVFPALLREHIPEQPVRIWVPGCATGEEAYSLAMGLLECMEQLKVYLPVQVFATDVSETALELARAGVYVENIALDVSPERLRRFFVRSGKSYVISKVVREMCIFARQDLTSDPPFSRVDLISCRNVLIYIEPPLQKRVLNVFHYALKPNGILVLGHSETTSSAGELFKVIDRKHKIFAKTSALSRVAVDFLPTLQPAASGLTTRPALVRALSETTGQTTQRDADRLVMARYAPPGVVISQDMHVVQFRGQTGDYLEPAPGEPSFNLMKMARPPLPMEIRTAVHKAQKSGEATRSNPVVLSVNGTPRTVVVEVLPLRTITQEGRDLGAPVHYVVLFEAQRASQMPTRESRNQRRHSRERPLTAEERHEVAHLKQDLAASREHMQSIIEEREAVNEELQSANEEILSSNEELQSINEELETAKEELQSTNEELTTVNEELRGRNLELTQLNNDLNNSLSSVNLPIVMLSTDLKIRRFTPMAERVLTLIPTDIGRPISDIRPKIEVVDLEARIAEVIDTMKSFEGDVRDRDGRWFSMRIRPYRTVENKIEGAVLTLVDVDASRRALEEAQEIRAYADGILALLPEPMCVLDGALRVRNTNGAFQDLFQVTADAVRGRFFYDLDGGPWRLHSTRVLLEEVLPRQVILKDHLLELELADGARQPVLLSARSIPGQGGKPAEFLLVAVRETKRRELQEQGE